ncbi:MAG: PQQ-like beta-propeller repeat protein, partial [Deltaproteobacteria bacterium]|nr:PQQ-like beta-propeller repeat protein [Deltaproteobacteria bacterium]
MLVVAALLTSTASGCGGAGMGILLDDTWSGDVRAARGEVFVVSWSRPLVDPLLERYQPTEHAVAALDPSRGRLYVGSSAGSLWSLDGTTGAPHWRFRATGAIGCEPALHDADGGRVFVGSDDGHVYALRRADGRLAWRSLVRAPVRRRPVVTEDAVYVVTGGDSVYALDRRTGNRLWSYRREAPEGFTIGEHAGLAFADGRLFTGFADGTTVALDASDGTL